MVCLLGKYFSCLQRRGTHFSRKKMTLKCLMYFKYFFCERKLKKKSVAIFMRPPDLILIKFLQNKNTIVRNIKQLELYGISREV